MIIWGGKILPYDIELASEIHGLIEDMFCEGHYSQETYLESLQLHLAYHKHAEEFFNRCIEYCSKMGGVSVDRVDSVNYSFSVDVAETDKRWNFYAVTRGKNTTDIENGGCGGKKNTPYLEGRSYGREMFDGFYSVDEVFVYEPADIEKILG